VLILSHCIIKVRKFSVSVVHFLLFSLQSAVASPAPSPAKRLTLLSNSTCSLFIDKTSVQNNRKLNTEKSLHPSLREIVFADIYAGKTTEVSFKLEFHGKFIFRYDCWKEMEMESLGMGIFGRMKGMITRKFG
jgi:hypothetical protein